MQATYSPEDNKLRLYPSSRLDSETYSRVKEAGFKWAPKQELFVAPAWTPTRADLLIELCGEIGDEDMGLVERAEERADRFGDYSENRARDAKSAQSAVAAIADNIPFGQPILVGHHSERHARRDAEKIESGMRRTVRMWEQSQYWKDRAQSAIRNAKYKELPSVRARRIKGLEAEERKYQKYIREAEMYLGFWRNPEQELTLQRAKTITSTEHVSACFPLDKYPRQEGASPYEGQMSLYSALDGIITPEQARDISVRVHERTIAHYTRWVEHTQNRLEYERAMLAEAGGIVTDQKQPEKGGACKCWASPRGGGWSYIQKVNKVSVTVLDNWGNGGANFTRTIPFDKLSAIMTPAEVEGAKAQGRVVETDDQTGFLLTPLTELDRQYEDQCAARTGV